MIRQGKSKCQCNVLADYGELFQLRNDVKLLTENNDNLKSTLETTLDQLARPSLRAKIFTVANTLIGKPLLPFPPAMEALLPTSLETVADQTKRKKPVEGGV